VCSQRDPGDTTAYRQQQCIQYADEELIPYVLDPHKQTLIDLQYFFQELLQGGDEVILFLDANQDEYQSYRPQNHDACFKTKVGFQVDGSIDGSLRSFMANCGLTNALMDVHSEQVPNTHVQGSKQIDVALVTYGIRPCIKAVGLLDESILKSNHRAIFLDLDLLLLFGTSLEQVERPQFTNLKLDDPGYPTAIASFSTINLNAITYTKEFEIFPNAARPMIGRMKMNGVTKFSTVTLQLQC
jgi:hypothetical protein